MADIIVLAQYHDNDSATCIGWEWGMVLKHAPKKDFGYGIINHYIPAEKLRPMDELIQRMLIKPRGKA